jgi:hypothetical protein
MSVADLDPSREIPKEDLSKLVSNLRRDNADLRDQVSQLEADLAQVQIELQLEVARFYCKDLNGAELNNPERNDPTFNGKVQSGKGFDAIAIDDQADSRHPQNPHQQFAHGHNPNHQSPHPPTANNHNIPKPELRNQELTAAQTQIKQLAQELESSQQTIQHQQLLVETLTEQLEGSQERIAQLERDCALTQQRYNEQVQLVLQAESVCRDLRMRLNRQQQQTLQFKIALEKSLEMKTGGDSESSPQPESAAHPITDNAAQATELIPKTQPVKPWSDKPSAPAFYSVARPHESGLPEVLSDLVPSELVPSELVVPSNQAAETQVSNPNPSGNLSEAMDVTSDINRLFPGSSAPQISPALADPSSQPTAAAIFDLSPFLEAGEVQPADLPVTNVRGSNASQESGSAGARSETTTSSAQRKPAPKKIANQEDDLWADLAKLIAPEMVTESVAVNAIADAEISTTEAVLGRSGSGEVVLETKALSQTLDLASMSQQEVELEIAKGDRERENRLISLASFARDRKRINPFEESAIGEAVIEQSEAEQSVIQRSTLSPVEPSPIKQPVVKQPWETGMRSGMPSFTLTPMETAPDQNHQPGAVAIAEAQTEDTSDDCDAEDQPNWPSPTLYPLRPTKKLKSMAAVDLPSFPRP